MLSPAPISINPPLCIKRDFPNFRIYLVKDYSMKPVQGPSFFVIAGAQNREGYFIHQL
jgi:hypothetical protein